MKSYIERLNGLNENERDAVVEDLISTTYHRLIDNDAVIAHIALTNASGWECDDLKIEGIEIQGDTYRVSIEFHANGNHDSDTMFCGESLSGTAVAVIDDAGHVEFEDVEVLSKE